MTTDEKLKHFEESSMEKAREQCVQMIEEHKAALDKIFKEHKAAKERQAALQIKTEADSLKRANNMALSKEQLQIKREITKKHMELKEKLFIEVQANLDKFMDSPAYHQLLIRQIIDIKKAAGSDQYIIYIDPADSSRQLSLNAETNANVAISENTFMGGTRAILPDRNILIDNSFAAKLDEVKSAFVFEGGINHE